MARNKSKKRIRCLDEIARLEGRRRLAIVKCTAALAVAIVVVAAKQHLSARGIIDPGNMIAGGISMIATFGLAIIGGLASIDFTKSGSRIRELKNSFGITDEETKRHRV